MLCLQCDLAEHLEQTKPPDPELVDLIEQAFLEGQIDCKRTELAYLWLQGTNEHRMHIQYSFSPKP